MCCVKWYQQGIILIVGENIYFGATGLYLVIICMLTEPDT